MEGPTVELGGPATGVIRSRAETKNDHTIIVQDVMPKEAEEETPEESEGEPMVKRFDIASGIQQPGVMSAAKSSTELYWNGGVRECSLSLDMELSKISRALINFSPEAVNAVFTVSRSVWEVCLGRHVRLKEGVGTGSIGGTKHYAEGVDQERAVGEEHVGGRGHDAGRHERGDLGGDEARKGGGR